MLHIRASGSKRKGFCSTQALTQYNRSPTSNRGPNCRIFVKSKGYGTVTQPKQTPSTAHCAPHQLPCHTAHSWKSRGYFCLISALTLAGANLHCSNQPLICNSLVLSRCLQSNHAVPGSHCCDTKTNCHSCIPGSFPANQLISCSEGGKICSNVH